MMKVKLTGWRVGFEKIKFNVLLREQLGLSLREAKYVVDEVLNERPVELEIPVSVDSDILTAQMEALGVVLAR